MKKFIALVLACLTLLTSSISAFAAQEYTIEPKVGGSGIAYYEEEIRREMKGRDVFIAFHPDFPNYAKVASYSFPAGEHNLNVSIGASVYFVSFSLAANDYPGYYTISADESLYSRPALYGNRYEVTYQYGLYNYNTRTWVAIQGTTTKMDYIVDSIKTYYA